MEGARERRRNEGNGRVGAMGEERPESFLLPRPIYPLPSIRYFSRLGGPYLMIISSGRYSRGRAGVSISRFPALPPYQPVFPPGGIVGEGEGRKGISYAYLPLPHAPTVDINRLGTGGRVLEGK